MTTKIKAGVIEAGAISTASLADTSITAAKLAGTLDLTGKTVTVATATAGDNDTTVASTAFVSTAIANLTDSAPAALDTLNELAAALNDDADFSTTVTNSIALKAPLASPDFTGDATFDTSTLVVDGTNNRVGVNVSNPLTEFQVARTDLTAYATEGTSIQNDVAIKVQNEDTTTNNIMEGIHIRSGTWDGGIIGVPLGNGLNNNGFLALISESQEGVRFYNDGTNGGTVFNEHGVDRDFRVESDTNTHALFVEGSSGNVGIGTTSPIYDFQIGSYGTDSDSTLALASTSTGTGTIRFGDGTGGVQANAGKIVYNHNGNYMAMSTAGFERLRIDSAGNVGIGTTSPTSFDAAGDNLIVGNGGGANGMTVYSGTVSAGSLFFADGTSGDAVHRGQLVYNHNGDYMAMLTAATEAMRIDSSGNLGIGTTSPTQKLDVNGTVELNNLTVAGSQGTDGQVLTSTGSGVAWEDAGGDGVTFKTFGTSSIMIGDDATGTINAANYNTGLGVDVFAALTEGDNNVAVGYRALTANTTGTRNTAVGYNSIATNTTATDNTAFGYQALEDTTTGSQNTAVGREALNKNTTGYANIAMGLQSSYKTTTGSYNIAIGSQALYSTTTGYQNIAIGREALYSNTANQNTAVGYQALKANTTASNNTAFGHFALKANTTGANNTAVGSTALDVNTGSSNTALGFNSLGANTTANNNVAVGADCLNANTTGTSNTAVGADALGANTTGSFSTAVGKSALLAQTGAGAENTAVGNASLISTTTGIGNTAVGEGSGRNNTTGSGNVAIGGDALRNNSTGNRAVAVGYAAGYSQTASSTVAIGEYAAYDSTTSDDSVYVGRLCGENVTTGFTNVMVGDRAGQLATTGAYNVFLGYKAGDNVTTGSSNIVIGSSNTSSATSSNECTIPVTTFRLQTGSITNYSDVRDKSNVEDSPYGLEFLEKVKLRKWLWDCREEFKKDNQLDGKERIGFIAQELLEAMNEGDNEVLDLVYESNPDRLEVRYSNLLPIALKAIQELSAKVKELEEKLND